MTRVFFMRVAALVLALLLTPADDLLAALVPGQAGDAQLADGDEYLPAPPQGAAEGRPKREPSPARPARGPADRTAALLSRGSCAGTPFRAVFDFDSLYLFMSLRR